MNLHTNEIYCKNYTRKKSVSLMVVTCSINNKQLVTTIVTGNCCYFNVCGIPVQPLIFSWAIKELI